MKADVQGVGESVLLDLEGYQFLMARDDARLLGSALLRVVASGGDVLDDPVGDLSQTSTTVDAEPGASLVEPSAQTEAPDA